MIHIEAVTEKRKTELLAKYLKIKENELAKSETFATINKFFQEFERD